MLTFREKAFLDIQRVFGYLNIVWFIPFFLLILKYICQYRIENIKDIRRQAAGLVKEYEGKPVIIAANHLTLIDSMIITWALFSFPRYLRQFRLLPWNVPEIANFGRNIPLLIMCYLGKCVYVERQGSRSSKQRMLDKLAYLLIRGDYVCLFPEGGRSRSGRVDTSSAAYGIGKLMDETPEVTVWCVYLRGARQSAYSSFPAWKERFSLGIEVVNPTSQLSGRRRERDLTLQVFEKLKLLENKYFDNRQ